MFSQTEERVIGLIGKKELSIAQLTKKFHKGNPPYGANNVMALTVRRIKAKCKINKLDWTLAGEGGGRAGRTVWKTKENVVKLKRVAYKTEPVLHINRYVAVIHTGKGEWYRYPMNLKEVRALKKSLKVGHTLEVYKADYNFNRAWHRTE